MASPAEQAMPVAPIARPSYILVYTEAALGAIETRTFKSGDSVAVRLPEELGFAPDVAVTIEQRGTTLTIKPAIDPVEEKRKLTELMARLRRNGPITPVQKREPIEFPDRPGLY